MCTFKEVCCRSAIKSKGGMGTRKGLGLDHREMRELTEAMEFYYNLFVFLELGKSTAK